MAPARRTIYIAGAGIAGLTLALALAKYGATVVVLERQDAIAEFGAGIQISPNAFRVLDALGLGAAVLAASFEPTGIDVYPFNAAKPLVTLELGAIIRERFGAPYRVMHRADLIDILYRASKRFANIEIVYSVRSFDAAEHTRGVSIVCDKIEGHGRTGLGFAFVGADGVHSLTRTKILAQPGARYSGRIAWRAMVPLADARFLLDIERTSLFFGHDHHLVAYPLPHRGQLNMALFTKHKQAPGIGKTTARPALRRVMRPDKRLDALVALAGESWTSWPLYTVETPIWHAGAIGIIGDAAHAMTPFQAQGAAMAIEDAATLAPLLMTSVDAATAFKTYEILRRKRIRRVAQTARSNGRIFHLEWPWTIGRDLVMRVQGRHGHLRRLAWLYQYDATTELSGHPLD